MVSVVSLFDGDISISNSPNVITSSARNEWQCGMALIDFTNPEAVTFYQSLIARLLDEGIDTVKTDFGERIPHLGVVYHNGSDPL